MKIFALCMMLAVTPGMAEAQGGCLSAAQARQAIAAGKADRLAVVLRRAGIRGDVVVRAALCGGGNRLYYQVAVLKGNKLETIRLQAN